MRTDLAILEGQIKIIKHPGQLDYGKYNMGSERSTDNVFVMSTLTLLQFASYMRLGAVFPVKTTLVTVWSNTVKSERKTNARFVISTLDYLLELVFRPFKVYFL